MMTSKERMLTAMRHGQPDMVPVSPDISNMIPCRLTGLPFWKMYYGGEYPLWRAHADAIRHFGFDGWQIHGYLNYECQAQRSFKEEVVSRSDGRFVVRTTCSTPAGALWKETTYFDDNPPAVSRNWIKNLKDDMPILRHMVPKLTSYDPAPLKEQMDYCGDTAAVTACVPVPGLHDLTDAWFDGGVEAAIYAMFDYPDELDELVSWETEHYLRMAEMIIDARPDFFMIGASGLWTLSTPEAFRKYSLPVIQKMTRMSKEAGLPSFLHSCGKQKELVKILAEETDLDVINPLEITPMGDCDLAEIKAEYGDRLAMMGNLHTTDVMLRGNPETVADECRKAIEAAAKRGGFILSTGDQCGRDTPFENIQTMIRVTREYGGY